MNNTPTSVIVLSGGQDSVTCFHRALATTNVVGAINFDYGQMHGDAERESVKRLEQEFPDINFRLGIEIGSLSQVTESALNRTTSLETVFEPHPFNPVLPASFLPGRNLIMLTLAAAYAQSIGANQIWTGVCETDYSGYPDCRAETIEALEQAICLGLDYPIQIITPLMTLDKADTFKMAWDLGVLDEILDHTHTGYTGERSQRYAWGWGPSGQLDPASHIRAKGWEEFITRYFNDVPTDQILTSASLAPHFKQNA